VTVSPPPLQPQRALQCLDQVQSLDALNRFEPADFAQALARDIGPPPAAEISDGLALVSQVGARLDALHQVLIAIEAFTRRIMGIRLLHGLASEPVQPQLRTLLSTTILSYAGDLGLLARRLDRMVPVSAIDTIMAAAEAVLALRHELQLAAFAVGQRIATELLPPLARAAGSPLLAEAQRTRLRQACWDLHSIAQAPEQLLSTPFEVRLKGRGIPTDEDLPGVLGPAESEPSSGTSERGRFSLLEID
jgi:hypothetical protein